MTDWEEKAILQELRTDQKQREMIARFAPQSSRKCVLLERQVTSRVMPKLAEFGPVNQTVHRAPFDLWVGGCRVELKAANWTGINHGQGRYQGTLRNCEFDVLLFVAINDTDHHFFIPSDSVGQRSQIAITSYDVNAYSGQWSAYLEAWHVLRQAVHNAPPRPIQLRLM